MLPIAAATFLAVASAPATGAAGPPPARASVWVTAKGTRDRLASKEPVVFEPLPQPDEAFPTILVDPAKAFQEMEGFGGALTDAAAETFARLPKERQRELLDAYFDPEKGLGYSLARTHINSCDFSSASYAYAEPGDAELATFSVAPDRRFRLPFIKAALATAKAKVKVYASPWSPPAWMKTNNDMLHGGKLKPEYRDAWARYYVRFVEEYEKEGVPMWGLTVQNEPMATQTWESCLFTGEEERDFVRDHLGPALEKAGLQRLKLMVWDHNRGILYQRAKAVYDDPAAARHVWGTAFHWYVGDHFDNVRIVHDAWPEKRLLFSEGTPVNYSRGVTEEWKWGEVYATSILRDVQNWAAGWTDWNVLLDEKGGPNHVGNFCLAPVHGDTRTGALTFTSAYYYIGHVSKFVRPGARRVATTSNDDDLLASAFANPDGRHAAVVMNKTDKDKPFALWVDGRAAKATAPAHSILTLVW
ncbi:MAG TPA: glycoside hydrolase family 30 beta sandwich domain-containing protein [Vicinamibacteria bacterium]|nr:glycoside hydrolase family 30 beta sandwich domain-containing protein [Vicinamibacteria bacterium]